MRFSRPCWARLHWNVYNNIARLQRGRRDCAPAIGGMETTRVVTISFSLCNKSTSPSKGQVSSKRADDGLSFFFPPYQKQPTRLRVSCLTCIIFEPLSNYHTTVFSRRLPICIIYIPSGRGMAREVPRYIILPLIE